MRQYRLSIREKIWRCLSTDGEWDGTWDANYDWIIYDDESFEVAWGGGFDTREEARKAGEKRLKELEERL